MARIVVTPAEEEDEVIVAGGGVDVPPEPLPGSIPEPTLASDAERATATESGHVASSSPKPSSPSPSRSSTLDDLESSPMPLAQRVVIAAAIVCIIGALVYYFVAMR